MALGSVCRTKTATQVPDSTTVRRMPFLTERIPNEETLAAMQEAMLLMHDTDTRWYSDVEKAHAELKR